MELKQALISVREKNKDERKKISSFVLADKDTHGGLNFEEDIREYWVINGSWIVSTFKEQTIQPDFGPTITKRLDESSSTFDEDGVLNFISQGSIRVEELSDFLSGINKELAGVN